MKKYLSIDYGGKRTGLATGDDLTGHVGPVGLIETPNPDEVIKQIIAAIDEHGPDELVIGIPYHMDGSMSLQAEKTEQLAKTLEEKTNLVVHRVDERLTSYAADEMMKQSGLTHKQKKARRDALAAMAILKDFMGA